MAVLIGAQSIQWPLLERARHLSVIDDALASGRAGRGGVVVFEGRPGLGKSRLLAEARLRAEAAGMRVLHARGHELERDFAFGVARQLFDPWLRDAPPEEHERVMHGAAHLSRRVLALEPMGETAEVDAFAPLHGLYWLTSNLSATQPLAIVIDDLHWVDAPTARWLDYLARRVDGLSVSVVAATRPDDGGADAPLAASLTGEPWVTAVPLGPLSSTGSAACIRTVAPGADDTLCHICHEAAGGNPLLLIEVAAALDLAGGDAPGRDEDELRAVAASAVGRMAFVRLSRLERGAVALAESVAVLGDRVALRDAAELAGLEDEEAAALTATLAENEILTSSTPLQFVHALGREAVYQSIPPPERSVRHATAAALLAARGAAPERVAMHVLASENGAVPGALEPLRAAARGAMSRGAPDTAARYLRRAMEEPGADAVRADLMHELGTALLSNRDPEAYALLREAMRLTDAPLSRAQRGLELALGLGLSGYFEEAVDVCRAVADDAEGDDLLAGHLEAELISCAYGSGRTGALAPVYRERLARRAERDPRLRALSLTHEAIARARVGDEPADAVAPLFREALRLGLMTQGATSLTKGITLKALLAFDDLAPTFQMLDMGLAIARSTGSPHLNAAFLTLRAFGLVRAGRLAQARADAEPAVAFNREQPGAPELPCSAAALIEVLQETDRHAEAAEVVEDAIERSTESANVAMLLERRAHIRAHDGDLEGALEDARRAGELCLAVNIHNPGILAWRSCAATILDRLGERSEARALIDEELRLARRFGRPRYIGLALHRASRLNGTTDVPMLREAISYLEQAPAPIELADAYLTLGAALRRANQRTAARDPLRRALDLADARGAVRIARGAREELLAAGARPRRARLSGPESLTGSEHRVAMLAAQGLSNREIAESLFITRRTVEVHLTRAYFKLGISGRAQLAEAMAAED